MSAPSAMPSQAGAARPSAPPTRPAASPARPLDDLAIVYRLRQRVRFAPLRAALADCIATVYPHYAQYILTEDDAYIELGRHHRGEWLADVQWRVVPNFEAEDGRAGAQVLREAAGFRLEETAHPRGAQGQWRQKTEVLADVQSVCAYLKARWSDQHR